jgi:hypothetical protein
MGPPVVNAHQIAGRVAGSTNGERPRWAAPKRNIDWAASIAYWGSGSAEEGAVPAPVLPGARALFAGHTQLPASQRRFSLQSWSPRQGFGSTWAHAAAQTAAAMLTERRRAELPRHGAGDEKNVRMGEG